MHTWSHGLSEFLRRSNEDAVCIQFISNLISRAARAFGFDQNSFLRIADVGCGPGSKAFGIANRLRRVGLKTHWDMVDHDPAWTAVLHDGIDNVVSQNEMRFDVHCPTSAALWSRSSLIAPHIAQFIQVAYDDETEEEIFNVTMELASQNTLVLISTEHPRSDLNKIRAKFTALGYGDLPSGRADSLASRLKKQDLIVREHFLDRQFLDIGQVSGGTPARWLLDLIFGSHDSSRNERILSETIDRFAETGFIRSIHSRLLNVPDTLLTVRRSV